MKKKKNEINIDEISKKPKKRRKRSKQLSVDQIVQRERRKAKKKIAIKKRNKRSG